MTFTEIVIRLGIDDYSQEIFSSHSRGELYFLLDYKKLAEIVENKKEFRKWFEEVVKVARNTWDRPESVFQHMYYIYMATAGKIENIPKVVTKETGNLGNIIRKI